MTARKLIVELTGPQARALFGAAVQRDTDLEDDDSEHGRPERARERHALDRAMRSTAPCGPWCAPPHSRTWT